MVGHWTRKVKTPYSEYSSMVFSLQNDAQETVQECEALQNIKETFWLFHLTEQTLDLCAHSPGGELHPAAGGGAESCASEPECQAPCAAVVERSGGDPAHRLPCRPHPCRRQTDHNQGPAAGPARQGVCLWTCLTILVRTRRIVNVQNLTNWGHRGFRVRIRFMVRS